MGKSKHDHKFTLGQFTWNGFNLTVGIAFLGSLAILANSQHEKIGASGLGLGFNIIWIFVIMGLIAGVCAFAFTRLSRIHKQDSNGGAYIFARSMFGRFIGFLILFLTYITLPLVLSNQILMFVKANFDPSMATGNPDGWTGSNVFWLVGWTKHLGNWSYLTYDFIGLLLSAFFVLAAFLGTKVYKKVSRYILIVKWGASGFLILFGVVAACLPMNAGNAAKWAGTTVEKGGLTVNNFLAAFCACFYYFTGFEAFASSGATVKEPEKNIGRGIMLVMISAVLFYVSMVVLFMFAQTSFAQNISTGFWINLLQNNNYSWLKWLLYAGPIVMLIFAFAMRGNASSQITLYAGTSLQPMSQEGYISSNFGEQNSDGFPIGAMKLNLIISSITIGAWAIIPDIIVGILGPSANFINVNTIISATSTFYILVYSIILLTALKCAARGFIKISIFEQILYIISLLALVIVFVYHFYGLLEDAFNSSHWVGKNWNSTAHVYDSINPTKNKISNIVACIIEFAFISVCIIFVMCVYFAYYQKKYKQRLQGGRNLQNKLNYEFRVLDGWIYFKGVFCLKANSFFNKRSKLVNANYENLSDDLFKEKYKKLSDNFLSRLQKQISNYFHCSDKIEKYNLKNNINNRKEININNLDAKKFLTFMESSIKKPPRDYIWLVYLKGTHYKGVYLPPSVYEHIRKLESALERE